jgi:competence protein ComEC
MVAAPVPEMTVHCINVGQGDATLLEFPCGAMLIDAGAQDNEARTNLINYLKTFFARRTDLRNTLESIIITHNHLDHTHALRQIATQFRVKRYIDNGQTNEAANAVWIRTNTFPAGQQVRIRRILDTDIPGAATGLTDSDIDPISCSDCDPKITLLSGQKTVKPTNWTQAQFQNKNYHSIVIRVDFGEASFLFSGDLELAAINMLLARYSGTSLLDVDFYHVGHHGSGNGTTNTFLAAIKPEVAVISVGKSSNPDTANFGHPRLSTFNILKAAITNNRTPIIFVPIAVRTNSFQTRQVRKNIWATAWDTNILVNATLDGIRTVSRRSQP